MRYSIATWNTLHRYHEEKYVPKSKVLSAYPSESQRIKDQLKMIKKISKKNKNIIICLQEVSGDLLDQIELHYSDNYIIHHYKHNRTPKKVIKKHYKDEGEYLVTMISTSFTMNTEINIDFKQFEKKGKALLSSILFDKFIIINAHISAFREGEKELIDQVYNAFMKQYIECDILSNIILCGDFNRTLFETLSIFDKNNIYNKLSCFVDLNTIKPYTLPSKYKSIDNIIGFGKITFDNAKILDVKNISDHNILLTDFYIDNPKMEASCKKIKKKYKKLLNK